MSFLKTFEDTMKSNVYGCFADLMTEAKDKDSVNVADREKCHQMYIEDRMNRFSEMMAYAERKNPSHRQRNFPFNIMFDALKRENFYPMDDEMKQIYRSMMSLETKKTPQEMMQMITLTIKAIIENRKTWWGKTKTVGVN